MSGGALRPGGAGAGAGTRPGEAVARGQLFVLQPAAAARRGVRRSPGMGLPGSGCGAAGRGGGGEPGPAGRGALVGVSG